MASQDTLSQSGLLPLDRSKYTSPPPPPLESITPPPSSQALAHPARSTAARTPSPRSHLSSPPPTIKAPPLQNNNGEVQGLFTAEQMADANLDDLRNMLSETTAAYREARASAAHQTLQYNLLNLETSEVIKRMAVELDMSQKEVDVLRTNRFSSSRLTTPVMSTRALTESPADEQLITNLRNRNNILEIEKDHLHRQLKNAKNLLLEREAMMGDEIDRLKKRIRDNRDHFRLLLQARGFSDNLPASTFSSPQAVRQSAGTRGPHRQVNSTPKQHRTPGGENSIATLLLADEALRNEAATSPSTPTGHHRKPMQHGAHPRGPHALSSMPATPVQAQTAPAAAAASKAYTPFYGSVAAQNPRTPQTDKTNLKSHAQNRRRESRDSTISASDISDHEEEYSDEGSEHGGDDVPASQASQEAANLLRKSASFRSPNQSQDSQAQSLLYKNTPSFQSKLYGQVTKAGQQSGVGMKRKMQEEESSPHAAKKGRRLNEGVGLGIGGWVSPGK